ncbi:unnamed protein product [Schistosoma rodhaini]|uniref:Macoilin n=1 Tax=Schistosoma rodhaini TaxID=6188 RepID=A0AA85G2F7_9TREM|nr:unnamed protein product [Schistosoma rodhaini]
MTRQCLFIIVLTSPKFSAWWLISVQQAITKKRGAQNPSELVKCVWTQVMYIRRRNYEHGRIKRNNRRNKSNESLHFIFGTYFKLLLAWASIIMLDFFTDLRFEFIWSCWLMVRTVNDSFRYQGLIYVNKPLDNKQVTYKCDGLIQSLYFQ